MLTSLNLNEKSREVCIKAKSPPASLAFIGQATKHTAGLFSDATIVAETSEQDYLISREGTLAFYHDLTIKFVTPFLKSAIVLSRSNWSIPKTRQKRKQHVYHL